MSNTSRMLSATVTAHRPGQRFGSPTGAERLAPPLLCRPVVIPIPGPDLAPKEFGAVHRTIDDQSAQANIVRQTSTDECGKMGAVSTPHCSFWNWLRWGTSRDYRYWTPLWPGPAEFSPAADSSRRGGNQIIRIRLPTRDRQLIRKVPAAITLLARFLLLIPGFITHVAALFLVSPLHTGLRAHL